MAKTGTLNQSIALSGFLDAAPGHELVFALVTNGAPGQHRAVRKAHEELVAVLYDYATEKAKADQAAGARTKHAPTRAAAAVPAAAAAAAPPAPAGADEDDDERADEVDETDAETEPQTGGDTVDDADDETPAPRATPAATPAPDAAPASRPAP